jgi:Skp family chaperone for outer membrane proteins
MRALSVLALAGMIAVCFLTACSQDEPRFAVVDLGRVISESQEGKKANAELDAMVKGKKAAAAEKADEFDKLKKSLDKEPAATRKSREDDLARLGSEYQKMVAASESEIRNKASELKAGLLKEIKNILNTIGSEEKYLLIVSSENAPYYQKSIDITDKVIMKYNELQGTK